MNDFKDDVALAFKLCNEQRERIAILERALLLKAKRDALPIDVITPEQRVKRWIQDAEASMKPVDAEECI